MANHNFKRSLILALAGIVIVIGVVSTTDIKSVAGVLTRADWRFLPLAVGAQLLAYLCLTRKLKAIADKYKVISYSAAFRIWLTGALIDLATPFIQVGGEPLKIFMLKRKGMKISKASAVVAADTFVELFAFFAMLVVAMLLLILSSKSPAAVFTYLLGVVMAALLISLAFFIILNKSLLQKCVLKVERLARHFGYHIKDYSRIVSSFESTFRSLLNKEALMLETFSLSIIAKALDFARIYFVFLVIGYPIGIDTVVLVWAILVVLSMLPGLPGNLGVIEAGGIAAYVLFGVPAHIAAAVIIIDRLISFWMLVGIGAAAFWKGLKK